MDVYELLLKAHRTVCGSVPDFIDALIDTILSRNTSGNKQFMGKRQPWMML
jgi:hypothetical protein